jgi:hypothetical protein
MRLALEAALLAESGAPATLELPDEETVSGPDPARRASDALASIGVAGQATVEQLEEAGFIMGLIPAGERALVWLEAYEAHYRDPLIEELSGEPAEPHSVNATGLSRRGFSAEQVRNIKNAFRTLYRSELKLADAVERLRESAATQPEPIFPAALRPATWGRASSPGGVAWRFRVPDGRVIEFHDGRLGRVTRTAGSDFGDFVVWRRDDLAAYELAVVADDHAMEIEEVVRGEDLLTSTARQLLLYEALGWQPPRWFHAPLVVDAEGRRLAKRTGGLAIRDLRARGLSPADVLGWRAA